MQFILKHQKQIVKIISIIQIAGGITGLFLIAYLLMNIEMITGPNLLIILIGLALYIFSTYCGKLLLTEKDKKVGIILSIINQIFQIFQWSLLGYNFLYSSGISLTIGIEGVSLNFGFTAIMSSFSMSIHSNNPFYLKINVAAIIIMCILIEIYNRSKKIDESAIIKDLIIEEEI